METCHRTSRAVLGRCVASVANAVGNGPTAVASSLETVGCVEKLSSMCFQGIWSVWYPWENLPAIRAADRLLEHRTW